MYPFISLYLILYYPSPSVKLGAWSLVLVACGLSTCNPSSNFCVLFKYAAGSVLWSSMNHGSRLLLSIFLFICILSFVMPCPGTWRRTSVYSYRGSALMASFFIEAYTLTNRPLSSYYAGLSFKSGYQQTGYHHHILSYYDVKYYYCLLLGAWSLVNLLSEVWFLEALQPHSFISVSAYNLSADQPATWPENHFTRRGMYIPWSAYSQN